MGIRVSSHWDFILLGVIAFALGVGGGPVEFHQDSILEPAWHALEHGGNPDFFWYPGGILIYPIAAIYGLTYLLWSALGIVSNAGEFGSLLLSGSLLTRPVEIHTLWPATLFIASFGVLGVLCVYAFARDLFGKRSVAWVAGLFTATAFIWTSHSHYITVDIPLAALSLATLYAAWRFTREGAPLTLRQLALLGVLVGLTTSAKYNGALVLLGVGAVILVHCKRNAWQALRDLTVIGLFSVTVFLLTNPFLLLDFSRFQQEFTTQMIHARAGHFGYTVPNGWLHQVRVSLRYGVGPLMLAFTAVGLVVLPLKRTLDLRTKAAVLAFPILFYLYMGQYHLGFYRYILPLVPFVAIYAAAALHFLYEWTTGRFEKLRVASTVVYLSLTLLIVLPNVRHTWAHNLLLGAPDTRVECALALRDAELWQIKPRIYSTPLIVAYAEHFGREIEPFQTQLHRDLSQDSVQMILLDSFVHDRLVYADLAMDTTMEFGLHDPNLERPLSGYEDMVVVQVTPYSGDKADVPFSPESYYSPFLPDLHYRTQRGPFIEMYLRDHDFANAVAAACAKRGQRCLLTVGDHGYYMPRLSRYAGLNRGGEFYSPTDVNYFR